MKQQQNSALQQVEIVFGSKSNRNEAGKTNDVTALNVTPMKCSSCSSRGTKLIYDF